MYEKIGQKIMGLAKSSTRLVIGFCVIMGIYALLTAEGMRFQVILLLAAIGYISYVSTWVLYGFGQLIDDVNAIRKGTEKGAEDSSDELPEL